MSKSIPAIDVSALFASSQSSPPSPQALSTAKELYNAASVAKIQHYLGQIRAASLDFVFHYRLSEAAPSRCIGDLIACQCASIELDDIKAQRDAGNSPINMLHPHSLMHLQGVNSPTFNAVSREASLTVPQLLDHHLEKSPHHKVFVYDDEEGSIVSVDFAQYIPAVHATCRRVLNETGRPKPGAVIAIFAEEESISYCMLVAAIMRAGLVPFCLSPRNAAAGVASLLKQASCTAVCISENLRHIIEDAFAIHGTSLPVFRAPTFLQMRLEQSTEPLPTLQAVSLDDTAVMLHSSGSTSLYSKPIYLSHKMILQYGYAPWTGNEDHCGQVLGAQTLPNYHAAGIFLTTWPLTSGLTIAVLRPTTPPLAPTPENTLSGVVATKPDIISSTPASIEAWSESSEGIRAMQSLKVLTYTGAPLNKRVGDDLVANGVVLCSFYGAMETGLLMPFLECHGPDWAYLRMRPGIEVKRKPEEDGSPLFTQIYIPSPSYVTCFTNTTVDDGRPGCFVSDLLEPHPEKPDLFRVYGRQDDTIVLSNGFKISPGPLESHINRNPFVNAALVFGQGRPYPGLLIQLAQQGGKVEFKTVDEISEALWDLVDETNKTATTHNRIARKMILLADPEKPFALTSKLQPRRFVVFDQYRDELDAAYM